MNLEKPIKYEKVSLAKFSATGDGMHIEIALKDESGNEIKESPIITFREEENEGLQVVVHKEGNDIVFPLSELKRAISFAEQEVHSETFYDENT